MKVCSWANCYQLLQLGRKYFLISCTPLVSVVVIPKAFCLAVWWDLDVFVCWLMTLGCWDPFQVWHHLHNITSISWSIYRGWWSSSILSSLLHLSSILFSSLSEQTRSLSLMSLIWNKYTDITWIPMYKLLALDLHIRVNNQISDTRLNRTPAQQIRETWRRGLNKITYLSPREACTPAMTIKVSLVLVWQARIHVVRTHRCSDVLTIRRTDDMSIPQVNF